MKAKIEESLKSQINDKIAQLEKQVADLKIVNNTVWTNSDDQIIEIAEKEEEIEMLQEKNIQQKLENDELKDQVQKLSSTNSQLLNALS